MLTSLEQLLPPKIDQIKKMIQSPAIAFKQKAFHDTLNRIIQCIIRERLLPFRYQDSSLYIECKQSNLFLIGKKIVRYSLSRIELISELSICNNHLNTPLSSLEDLFKILKKEWQQTDSEQLNTFFKEINNSCDNMAITLEHVNNKRQILKSLFDRTQLIHLTQHLCKNAQALFYEQWASQGHLTHPLVKAKLGLSPDEVIAYSPEFSPVVKLSIIALHRSLTVIQSETPDTDYKKYFSDTFSDSYTQFQSHLNQLSLNPDDYFPLFIHPWQEKNVFPLVYAQWIAEKKVVSLKDIEIEMRPSLSFRTLYSSESIPQVKLPITVRCTTVIRTLSPHSVQNSPCISGILRDILNKQHTELTTLRILYDSIAIRINTDNHDRDKQLAMLLRDTLSTAVRDHETPIISAALFSNTLQDNTPLLIEMINTYYGHHSPTVKQVIDYFSKLVEIILKPNLFLYIQYGIALESHQQNSVIIFNNDEPTAILIKDLGGIRIHEPTLKSRGYTFQASPGSAILTDENQEVRHILIHTVYQTLLGEFIILLNKHYKITESLLWGIVKQQTKQNLILFCEGDEKKLSLEMQTLIHNDWPIKSFISMRLHNKHDDYIYNSTENPLASC